MYFKESLISKDDATVVDTRGPANIRAVITINTSARRSFWMEDAVFNLFVYSLCIFKPESLSLVLALRKRRVRLPVVASL